MEQAGMKNETAVVTGGAGFIGSHLCDRLLEMGYRVLCVDNLCTGSRRNIAHLDDHAAFTFHPADVREPLEMPPNVRYIFHLASPASPIAYFRMPIETAMTNAAGTSNMLETALSSGARFLLTSTSEAYGDPLVHPQVEDDWGNVNPIGPRSCYDEGKRFAESLTFTYLRTHNLEARVVRIFNTYGPRSDPDDGRMVPTFIRQALANEAMPVYGDGSQTRSLCYVDDLVEGLLAAMFNETARGEVINLGCPDERTVMDYATIIRDLCRADSAIETHPAREDEPVKRRPDISKAKRLLNWEPTTSLETGLAKTIFWFREQLPAASTSR